MAVYKTGKRWRYRATVRLPDGSTIRVSGTPSLNSRAEASDAERAHIHRTLHPVVAPTPVKQSPLTKDFISKWWDLYQVGGGVRGKNAPTTIKEKSSHLNHILPALGGLRLDEITNERLTEFAGALRNKGLGEKTLKNIFTTLGTILRTAVDWDVLGKMPKMPQITPPSPEWDWLGSEAIERIRALPVTPESTFTLVAITTGMRLGELVAVEWDDFDFVRREVRAHRNRPNGAHKTTVLKGKRGRTLPLTDDVCARLFAQPKVDARVFPISPYLARKAVAETLKAAGVESVGVHSLRHSYASILVSNGVPLRRVQELLDHRSAATTQRYAHLCPGTNNDVLEALR